MTGLFNVYIILQILLMSAGFFTCKGGGCCVDSRRYAIWKTDRNGHGQCKAYDLKSVSSFSQKPIPLPTHHAPNLPGGLPMKKHQWPFLVSIVRLWGDNQTDKACGGSVISSNLVLTAAHCFHGEKETFLVIVGDFDAATHEGPEQYRRVEKVITHPAWDPLTFNHDIAILKLEEQLDLVPGVVEMVPLNLDPRCPPDGLTCLAGGWGQMEENVNGGPDVPVKFQETVVTSGACSASYEQLVHDLYNTSSPDVTAVGRGKLCARLQGPRGACPGDSGGPFMCMCEGFELLMQTGIISYGGDEEGCGLPSVPDVFTRVSAYIPWIGSVMMRYSDGEK